MVEESSEWTDEDLEELHKLLSDKGAEIHAVLVEAGYSSHEMFTFAVLYLTQIATHIEGEIIALARALGRWYYAVSMPSLKEIRESYGLQQVESDSPETADPSEPAPG